MNKNTNIDINRMIKGAFAFVLAGSLIIPSSALAEENGEIGLQVVEEASSQEGVENVPSSDEIVVEETDELEVPSLLPGDFFYFAKQALEKIQLILTFDDVKEAKLLADFATERLAEAEALFLEGKEEEALEMLKAALDNLSVAEETVNPDEDTEIEEIVIDSEESTNESDDSNQEVIENDEDAKETEEVEKQISQNIIALTAAMEKVKNPVAKAALQKNIEKSYAKLAKKMAKLDKEKSKEIEEVDTKNEVVVEDEEIGLTVIENAEPEEEVTTSSTEAEEASSLNESTPLTTTVDKAEKKIEKQEAKAVKKEEKQIEKNQQKQPNPNSNEKQGNGKN